MFNKFPQNHWIDLNLSSLKWCSLINCKWCISQDVVLVISYPLMKHSHLCWHVVSPAGGIVERCFTLDVPDVDLSALCEK